MLLLAFTPCRKTANGEIVVPSWHQSRAFIYMFLMMSKEEAFKSGFQIFKNNAFSEEEQSILKGSPTLLEQQRVRYIGAASPTKASSNRIGDYWCLGLGYFVTARGDATQENVKFDTVDHGIRPVIRIDIGAL